MNQPASLFLPLCDDSDHSVVVECPIACIDSFTCAFNLSDLAKDAHLHSPIVILSAENLAVWERPGRLPVTFFDELQATTGWDHTTYTTGRPCL
jgi:hypothetical protein